MRVVDLPVEAREVGVELDGALEEARLLLAGIDAVFLAPDLQNLIDRLLAGPLLDSVLHDARLGALGPDAVRLAVALPVVGDKEVELVLKDGAPDGEAALRLGVLLEGPALKVGIRGEPRVPKVAEDRPFELVGAGLGDRLDRAGRAAPLGHAVAVGHHLKFLKGLHRKDVGGVSNVAEV